MVIEWLSTMDHMVLSLFITYTSMCWVVGKCSGLLDEMNKHLDRIKSHKKKTYIAYHFVDVPCTSYVLNATTTMEVRQNAILNG